MYRFFPFSFSLFISHSHSPPGSQTARQIEIRAGLVYDQPSSEIKPPSIAVLLLLGVHDETCSRRYLFSLSLFSHTPSLPGVDMLGLLLMETKRDDSEKAHRVSGRQWSRKEGILCTH